MPSGPSIGRTGENCVYADGMPNVQRFRRYYPGEAFCSLCGTTRLIIPAYSTYAKQARSESSALVCYVSQFS